MLPLFWRYMRIVKLKGCVKSCQIGSEGSKPFRFRVWVRCMNIFKKGKSGSGMPVHQLASSLLPDSDDREGSVPEPPDSEGWSPPPPPQPMQDFCKARRVRFLLHPLVKGFLRSSHMTVGQYPNVMLAHDCLLQMIWGVQL